MGVTAGEKAAKFALLDRRHIPGSFSDPFRQSARLRWAESAQIPELPLLSNLLLDDLDLELQMRGHRFVRYADDCNISVRSERARHQRQRRIQGRRRLRDHRHRQQPESRQLQRRGGAGHLRHHRRGDLQRRRRGARRLHQDPEHGLLRHHRQRRVRHLHHHQRRHHRESRDRDRDELDSRRQGRPHRASDGLVQRPERSVPRAKGRTEAGWKQPASRFSRTRGKAPCAVHLCRRL